MAEGLRSNFGGILSLLDRLDDEKFRKALEADLMRAGLRLRWFPSVDYTWRDLLVFVQSLGEDSATVRASLGADAYWGLTEQLLALNADYLRILIWMKTKDAQHNRNFPKPIPRPGVDDGKKRTKIHGTSRPTAELSVLLGM